MLCNPITNYLTSEKDLLSAACPIGACAVDTLRSPRCDGQWVKGNAASGWTRIDVYITNRLCVRVFSS